MTAPQKEQTQPGGAGSHGADEEIAGSQERTRFLIERSNFDMKEAMLALSAIALLPMGRLDVNFDPATNRTIAFAVLSDDEFEQVRQAWSKGMGPQLENTEVPK